MTSRLSGGGMYNNNDQFDFQSLLAINQQNTMMNDVYSNTDTFNNSFYDPSLRKQSSMFGVGGGGNFMDNVSEFDRSNYDGVQSFVPSIIDPSDQDTLSKIDINEISDKLHPRN